MLNQEEEGEEEDDISFYVQTNEPNMLKSISGSNSYGNLADERIKINREPPIDEYRRESQIRRQSIIIREHQLAQYPINYDPSPQIIRKKLEDYHEPIVYKQQIAVRYLCPPTPPPPAPLIIREIRPPEPLSLPPIIIRQQPPPPVTPPPIIIRERPPTPPSYNTPQIIYKRVSPVKQIQRRVIIERLPQMPAKPPDIIVERWLPYKQQKRKVIYEKALPTNDNSTSSNDQYVQNRFINQYKNPLVQMEKQMRSLSITSRDRFEQDKNSYLSSQTKNTESIYDNTLPLKIEYSNQRSN
ncbi:unnamed protein product [Rotaria sordida]|uniref:Uncharacterized protein n=1 Tax=Rotaria sordida TaxID=392033 RepID=A0A814H4Z0_9BILA|nr:unnamed protein product [Rotaria sordida]CAF1004501.1 unnamed protein product [Rotaria sordida]CAF1143985.1 unnamed protein product [Rotaria sordida]CAF3518148.1 unnamed protein product [Rotaria sordida]